MKNTIVSGISIITIIFIMCLGACQTDEELIVGSPKIIALKHDTLNRRDKITIYGENMRIFPQNSFILLDGKNRIQVEDISVWNNSRIEFLPPNDSGMHTINLVLGPDTTNQLSYYIRNIRNIEMVKIESGNYIMGSDVGLMNESPAHKVTLTRSIYVSKFEICQAEWSDIIQDNPSIVKSEELPIHNLDWIQAIDFCNLLSKELGLNSCYEISANNSVSFNYNANGYRLPTEAEWEYICKAGSDNDYSGTNDLSTIGWYSNNSLGILHSSGKLLANQFGVYDIHGNLWEWCWDIYLEHYYSNSEAIDPAGAQSSMISDEHVLRGGSYADGRSLCRSTNRNQPVEKKAFTGIRIVRNI